MELRAVVYGVADEAVGWRWYVSIAMEADLSWWRRRGVEALWVLDPGARVSAGEALERRAALEAGRCGRESSGRPGAWVSASGASWAPEPEAYARWMRRLEGRLLLREEIERMDGAPEPWAAYAQWGALEGRVRLRHGAEREPGSARGGLLGRLRGLAVRLRGRIGGGASSSGARWTGYRCTRCGSGFPMLRLADCALCGGPCPYCEGCLGMGRVRYCAVLVQGTAGGELRAPTESSAPPDREVRARWGLSAAQAEAAGEALRFLRQRLASAGAGRGDGRFLLWAVTGAGKTEMMFPLVEATLIAGGRALVATPRKDVVLELAPRFKAAFPRERVATLYGGSEERWDAGTITIATTHQLFRFREAFELVVLDELDAFPYHGDPQLAFAAERARRPGGAFVLLSATPPPALRREALRGRLPYA
ncbi:DEAD/DEAH box helicase, partial [Paenibacillus sp.]|uniref:DEAD/DEAH box helicase n=1 Tax=Paenibacillus sp. TaxID=58172 RepID=UPI002D533694